MAKARGVTVKPTGCGFKEMKYLIKFIFSFFRSGVEIKRGVLPLNTQYLQNSAESREQSVLTLGSLCLPCCERDTA